MSGNEQNNLISTNYKNYVYIIKIIKIMSIMGKTYF